MKRKTLRFIDRNNGITRRIDKKTVIIASVSLLLAVALGGSYLWYSRYYGNAPHISIHEYQPLSYDWKQAASENNIVGDYLWSRTRKLMLKNSVLIPSECRIAGRLTGEDEEFSDTYRLSDQALLLKAYIKAEDRSAAIKLKDEVNNVFGLENGLYKTDSKAEGDGEVSANIEWIDAYLRFYAVYGRKDDYDRIGQCVKQLFGDDGLLKPYKLTAPKYDEESDVDAERLENFDKATLEEVYGSDAAFNADGTEFDGVKLSDMNLRLIHDLEENSLLPKGSYDKALEILEGGVLSDEIPYYAYAFKFGEDKAPVYMYSAMRAGCVDIPGSIRVMEYLSDMGKLPDQVYTDFKNSVLNDRILYSTYYIAAGNSGGSEALDSYASAMRVAINKNDLDLYGRLCNVIGTRVASRQDSPALYMIFRQDENRYDFLASENLGIRLVVG